MFAQMVNQCSLCNIITIHFCNDYCSCLDLEACYQYRGFSYEGRVHNVYFIYSSDSICLKKV